MYVVVEFLGSNNEEESSNEIAVVPLIWVTKQEKRCYWPNRIGKTTFTEFVKAQSPYKSTWPSYKVYKIHFRTENYTAAEDFLYDLIREINNNGNTSTASTTKSITRKQLHHVAVNEADVAEINVSNTSLASTITLAPSPSASVCSSGCDKVINEICKISSIVDQQTIILNELLRNSRSQMIAAIKPIAPTDVPTFPLKTIGEFENFNVKLKDDEPLRRYMVSRLSAVGGSGVEALTRRMLKFLINDDVAATFNWKGRGDKEPFTGTAVVQVILEAAKINFPDGTKEKSDLTIADTIKCWLKYATSRLKHVKKP